MVVGGRPRKRAFVKSNITAGRSRLVRADVFRIAKSAARSTSEKKFHDVVTTGTIQDIPVGVALTDVPQGSTDLTRVGDSLTVKSLQIRISTLRADSTNIGRLVIIQWLPTIEGIPPVAELFQLATGGVTAPLTQFNHDHRRDYRVLWDSKPYNLDGVQQEQRLHTVYLPLYKMKKVVKKIQYVAGSTTRGAGKLFIFGISDSTAVTHPPFNFRSRVNFTDS